MELFLSLFYALLFGFIIYKSNFFHLNSLPKRYLLIFFFIKILAGFLLYFIYTYYYPNRGQADIFRYFDDAKIIYSAFPNSIGDYFKIIFGIANDTPYFTENYYAHMNHWDRIYFTNIFTDSHLIIRLNAFLMLFSFGYYNVHTIFAAFLSFVGLFSIYQFVERNVRNINFLYVIVLFLTPSVLFWTSNMLKECLLLFAIGLLINAIDKFTYKNTNIYTTIMNLVVVLFSCIIILYTKMYYLIILFPLCILFVINKKYKFNHILPIYLVGIIIFGILSYFSAYIMGYDAFDLLAFKYNDSLNLAIDDNARIADKNYLEANLWAFLCFLPRALFNAIFQPWFPKNPSVTMLFSTIELIAIWIFIFVFLLLGFKKNLKNKNLFYFCFFFAMINFLIIGYASPIIGAIVRYRSISLPFLLIAILSLCDKDTMKKRMKIMKMKINNKLQFFKE